MNLRQLEVFNAVMQAGTITGAARLLNLTQPAVSKLLQHAEDQLRIPLFKRVGGRLHPTPEALTLFPEVENVFSRLRVIQQMTADLKRNVWNRISLATPVTLGTSVVSTAVAKLRAAQPEVSFTVYAVPARHIGAMVIDGEVEIGLVVTPFEHALTSFQEIGEAEVVCIMPPDHALARLRTVAPADLKGHTLITGHGHRTFSAMLDAAFGSTKDALDVPLQVTNSIIACGLVARGAGIAVTDPFAAKHYFPNLAVRKFRPRIALTPRIIHRRDRPLSRTMHTFIDTMRQEMAN